MSISGYIAQKDPSKRGTKYFAVLTTATFNLPRLSPLVPSIFCSKESHAVAISRAVRASSLPASVKCTRRAMTS